MCVYSTALSTIIISEPKELLHLFREYTPDICFHLEIHPALLSEELKEELAILPNGLLHLEAGIQSLREPVLEKADVSENYLMPFKV